MSLPSHPLIRFDSVNRLLTKDRAKLQNHVRVRLAQVNPFLRRRIDAADVVQEIAVIALVKQEELSEDNDATAWTWLTSVADNHLKATLRNMLRKKRDASRLERALHTFSTTSAGFEQGMHAPTKTPSSTAAHSESSALLGHAVQKLSHLQRQAVVLHFIEGLSYREVAERLGSTPQAARSLVYHAVRNLSGDATLRSLVQQSSG